MASDNEDKLSENKPEPDINFLEEVELTSIEDITKPCLSPCDFDGHEGINHSGPELQNSTDTFLTKTKINKIKPLLNSAPTHLFEKKPKLRTSEDVYHRLKWAPETIQIDHKCLTNLEDIYIGYKDRFLGICEIPFTEYNPEESDIPFHRIYYYRIGGRSINPFIGEGGEVKVREDNWPEGARLVWDRERRIDLIFNSGETNSRRGKGKKIEHKVNGASPQ